MSGWGQAIASRAALQVPRSAVSEGGIFGGMRVKTSVTIERKVLRAIDRVATHGRSRSRILEEAAVEFLARRVRAAREARDLAILNREADSLNREMEDVLLFQADV